MLEQQFDEYKAEYSHSGTTIERKDELIRLIQENLKERCGNSDVAIGCLDGQEYSLDSKNIEHLYAIDGILRSEKRRNQLSEMGNIARLQAQSRNNYGPNNPYPNN